MIPPHPVPVTLPDDEPQYIAAFGFVARADDVDWTVSPLDLVWSAHPLITESAYPEGGLVLVDSDEGGDLMSQRARLGR